ncbi:MAG: ATP-grasp domain-containing protein, partial [Litorilinea sp.]
AFGRYLDEPWRTRLERWSGLYYAPIAAASRTHDVYVGGRLKRKELGLPVTPFCALTTASELDAARRADFPAILKTAAFGYDGKGQVAVDQAEDLEAAWDALGRAPAILEKRIAFAAEVSLVGARNARGEFAAYPLIENRHVNHILDISLAPAQVAPSVAADARRIAETLFTQLDVVGVLCIEFFLTASDALLINEIAPRPHNSGHLTIEAAGVSQFEQQVRAVCNLPLGDTRLRAPAAMANLLGDLWEEGMPDWPAALAMPGVALHLYGKHVPRPGRKMGHLTAWAASTDEAVDTVTQARARVAAILHAAQG